VIVTVAVLLFPSLWVLLLGMDRLEDRILKGSRASRPAHAGRHLRLIPGGRGTGKHAERGQRAA
jgi:hypothetical protein